jgi:NADH-dependent peroxiredoxin subunit F
MQFACGCCKTYYLLFFIEKFDIINRLTINKIDSMQDLIIIGGGPAGVAAGVYASRKQLKTILITDTFGGQSIVSTGIENWIGDINISGEDLAKKLENHLKHYSGEFVEIKKGERVEKITQNTDKTFTIKISGNNTEYQSKAVLIATGSNRRKLEALGADEFEHKGLTYCASCDGPFYAGQDVVVVGGGNSAFESAAQLLAYCKTVTLIHRRNEFKADPVTIENLSKNPNFKILTNTIITEVSGEQMLNKIKIKNTENNQESELSVGAVFVEIGAVPSTNFANELVDTIDGGHIKIDPWNQKTSIEGIWAAGDCTNVLYHQNNIAAGDAVKALEDIYLWLRS